MGVVIISTGTRSTQKQRRKVWITAATVCHRRRVPVTSFVFNLFRQIWRASIISSRVARVMRQRVMWAIVISVVRVLWAIVISVVRVLWAIVISVVRVLWAIVISVVRVLWAIVRTTSRCA